LLFLSVGVSLDRAYPLYFQSIYLGFWRGLYVVLLLMTFLRKATLECSLIASDAMHIVPSIVATIVGFHFLSPLW